MRIYIDCTDTFHSQLNTGIQRVVRNIVNLAPAISQELDVECIPVIVERQGYKRVAQLSYGIEKRMTLRFRMFLNHWYLKIIRGIAKKSPFPKLSRFLTATKHEFGLTRLILLSLSPLSLIKRLSKRLSHLAENHAQQPIQPGRGDVLLLADSVWNYNFWDMALKARQEGVIVITIVYDIIPISHPELVDEKNIMNFTSCLPKLYGCVDGFLGISDYTKIALKQHLQMQDYAVDLSIKHFDFFHLGANLDVAEHAGSIRANIKNSFGSGASTYLIVGTIEPRKNHLYALEAFNLVWREIPDVSLMIIGKIGWLYDNILEAIYSHPLYGRRLFLITDASDAELDYCYSHAKALLFPSIIEGFGLPLIEAQMKRLPVFASDIPVFREVGKDSAAYFDISNPHSFASMLIEYEQTRIFPAAGPEGFTWMGWQESAHQMLTRLVSMVREIQSERGAT